VNWIKMLMSLFQVTPLIVAGIEKVHADASGATKKQMAMDALGLATGVASSVLPGQAPAIAAASQLASDVIDGVVATFNAAGIFQGHTTSPPVPAPVVSATSGPSGVTAIHPSGGN